MICKSTAYISALTTAVVERRDEVDIPLILERVGKRHNVRVLQLAEHVDLVLERRHVGHAVS